MMINNYQEEKKNQEEDFEMVQRSELLSNTTFSPYDLAHSGVNLAYKGHHSSINSKAERLHLDSTKLVGTGWEVLYHSSESTETNQYGYKAVAFVNRVTNQIHISAAGTKETHDLIDDAGLVLGYVPNKIIPLKNLVSKVVELTQGAEYTFSTSGHSLGAVVSDLTAAEIVSRGLKFEKSTTFENPGSLIVVKTAIAQKLFTGKDPVEIEKLAQNCVEYNAKPNFINTSGPHLASKINFVAPIKSNLPKVVIEEPASTALWSFGKFLYNKVGSAVNKCSDILGVTQVIEQINSHKHSNFANLENATVIEIDSWNNQNLEVKDNKSPGYIDFETNSVVKIENKEEEDGFTPASCVITPFEDYLTPLTGEVSGEPGL